MTDVLRVIADVHGQYNDYLSLANDPVCEYSLQIGDMGFSYDHLKGLDWRKHLFFAGNHDNYDKLISSGPNGGCFPLHNLGDFGPFTTDAGHSFYFVRGAASIDAMWRVQEFIKKGVKSWWHEEELDLPTMNNCMEEYVNLKPDVMITHDAPKIFNRVLTKPVVLRNFGWDKNTIFRTTQFLQELWMIHKPKLWLCGHYHVYRDTTINDCRFICLPELGYKDFLPDWSDAEC